jgi:hypothetical protein
MKGRTVKVLPFEREPVAPTVEEIAAYLIDKPGAYLFLFEHDSHCPCATSGKGDGCVCQPDVTLKRTDGTVVARW